MTGYAQTTIVGNVGRDVNMRYLPSGVAVADFSVAVTTRWGKGEDRKEKTVWYKATAWREAAEVINQYVKKGDKILLVGTVDVSAYMDKSGQPAATLELTISEFQFLGSKGENGERRDTSDSFAPPAEDLNDIPF